MPISTGDRLGPYEILGPIGAGGMGEVYKARDTRLDRTVAIKVSAAQFSERFDREARAVAALNHPNICTLFDVGPDYLVMEYLEGETVAARLVKGPFAPVELLRYAIQIAESLDHAHRKGVLHRDLKPANVMMTKAGAKLLDFGLAKLDEPGPAGDSTHAMTAALTERGTIIGTLLYMSPEQLEGKPADTRSDIFAFGALLYEMATGKNAFQGKSRLTVVSAIMERIPPPVSSLQPMCPPALDRIIQRCLAKDPDDRWQTARDLMLELKWIAEAGSQAGVAAPVTAQRRNRERTWIFATAALGLMLVAALVTAAWSSGWLRAKPVDPGAARFLLPPPEGVIFALGPAAPHIAPSPDGRHLAIVATPAGAGRGGTSLWVRALGSFAPQRLDKTEGAQLPFWSPDGQSIGFFADQKLKRIPISGGSPQTTYDAPGSGEGATWNREGVVLFATGSGRVGAGAGGPIHRVPASGGVATDATQLDPSRDEIGHVWPHFLPDGRHFLYLARSRDPGKSAIYVQQLGANRRTLVAPSTLRAAFSPPGYLLFVREGTLLAQPMDSSFKLLGEPVSIADEVNDNELNGRVALGVSGNGVLVYRTDTTNGYRQLAWFDRAGKDLGTVGELGRYSRIRLSPDEKRLVFIRSDGRNRDADLWVLELASGISSRLTMDTTDTECSPVWSPDSQRVIYHQHRKGGLREVAITSGATSVLQTGDAPMIPGDWSPDGRFLVYAAGIGSSKVSLWPLTADRTPQPILDVPYNVFSWRFSPDGRWIAYTSSESGADEIYIASFPGFAEKRKVSNGGGVEPRWRADGKELFFVSASGHMMALDVKAGAKLETRVAKELFHTTPFPRIEYAVSADGKRFLLPRRLQEAGVEHVHVVLNWLADLRR